MTRRASAGRRACFVACAGLGALSGCVSDPATTVHERPLATTDLAAGAPATAAPPATAKDIGAQAEWWRDLHDPQLDALIATAIARNPAFAGALARVRAAREQAHVADAAGMPQVAFEGYVNRERFSENYIFPPPYGGGTYWEGRLGFNLNWNLDFWGRQAALASQAGQSAAAIALDAAQTELMLSGAVAQTYVEYVRALRNQQVAERAQAQRIALLELTRQRVGAGLDSKVELRAAEGNVEQSGVDIEQARLAAALARNALAALTGASAANAPALGQPTLDLESALPVPGTLPLDLLAARPDVSAARMRVAAATSAQAAAHANFYPNVNLVAFAGVAAIGLDQLFQGDSHQWTVGPAVHLPVFDAGRLKAEYRRAGAEVDAAIAAYNETLLRAARETSDQATRLQSLATQLDAQGRALAAAEQAYSLATQRYGAGLASQLTVLNAETQVLAARRQRTQLLADRTAARIALLVALGGHYAEEPAR